MNIPYVPTCLVCGESIPYSGAPHGYCLIDDIPPKEEVEWMVYKFMHLYPDIVGLSSWARYRAFDLMFLSSNGAYEWNGMALQEVVSSYVIGDTVPKKTYEEIVQEQMGGMEVHLDIMEQDSYDQRYAKKWKFMVDELEKLSNEPPRFFELYVSANILHVPEKIAPHWAFACIDACNMFLSQDAFAYNVRNIARLIMARDKLLRKFGMDVYVYDVDDARQAIELYEGA